MALTDQQSYVYWIERDGIAIAKYDKNASVDNRFSSPPAGKTITLYVVKSPTLLTTALTDDPSTDPGLPKEFCEAFVEKAIQKGYEVRMGGEEGAAGAAQYWGAKFDSSVREGKKYATKRRASGSSSIKGYDY